jgi:hypothetical protein
MIRPRDTTSAHNTDTTEDQPDSDTVQAELQQSTDDRIEYIQLPPAANTAAASRGERNDDGEGARALLSDVATTLHHTSNGHTSSTTTTTTTTTTTLSSANAANRLVLELDTATRNAAAAVAQRSRARHAGGSSTGIHRFTIFHHSLTPFSAEIYQLADNDNCQVLKDLDIPDDLSIKFRKDLYRFVVCVCCLYICIVAQIAHTYSQSICESK